jgi:hypothetical protein
MAVRVFVKAFCSGKSHAIGYLAPHQSSARPMAKNRKLPATKPARDKAVVKLTGAWGQIRGCVEGRRKRGMKNRVKAKYFRENKCSRSKKDEVA